MESSGSNKTVTIGRYPRAASADSSCASAGAPTRLRYTNDVSNGPAQSVIESPYKGKKGIRRILNAFLYSVDGLAAAFKHEDAFRQEVALALILIPIALSLSVTGTAKCLMVLSLLLVLIVEPLNSGIEAVTDRVSLEDHALAKRAKDLGSAAVMISLVAVPVVWLLVLLG